MTYDPETVRRAVTRLDFLKAELSPGSTALELALSAEEDARVDIDLACRAATPEVAQAVRAAGAVIQCTADIARFLAMVEDFTRNWAPSLSLGQRFEWQTFRPKLVEMVADGYVWDAQEALKEWFYVSASNAPATAD